MNKMKSTITILAILVIALTATTVMGVTPNNNGRDLTDEATGYQIPDSFLDPSADEITNLTHIGSVNISVLNRYDRDSNGTLSHSELQIIYADWMQMRTIPIEDECFYSVIGFEPTRPTTMGAVIPVVDEIVEEIEEEPRTERIIDKTGIYFDVEADDVHVTGKCHIIVATCDTLNIDSLYNLIVIRNSDISKIDIVGYYNYVYISRDATPDITNTGSHNYIRHWWR